MILKPEFEKFLIIYEESSLSKAADKLDTYQGALSKTLSKLEDTLSMQLFIRSNRGLIPTPKGHSLYTQIHQQSRLWQSFSKEQNNKQDQFSGPLRIGGHATVLLQFTKKLADLKHKFPLLDLQLSFGRSPEITRSVLNHELDMAIVVNPTEFDELVIKPLKKETVAVFAPSKEANTDLLIYNPELISSHSIIKHKKKSKQLLPISDYEVAAKLASHLKATALLPESVALRHKLNHQIGAPILVAQISLIFRSDHYISKGLHTIVKMLKK